MERKEITIFTDGSCYWKIKKGGIGVYMICDGEETFISKGYKKTTIGRCEMRALLTAIQSLRKDIPISATVYSDSRYVVDGLVKNIKEWVDNDWKGCMNVDLWKAILKELKDRKKLRLRLIWHPGHKKNINDPIVYGNAVADILANYKNFTEYELDKIEAE